MAGSVSAALDLRLPSNTMEHFDAQLDEIRLHLATACRGKPVVLLHGFPEFDTPGGRNCRRWLTLAFVPWLRICAGTTSLIAPSA